MYSPFFNLMEKAFSKFKFTIKNCLLKGRDDLLNLPEGIVIENRRYQLFAFPCISSSNCASYDHHSVIFNKCLKINLQEFV